MKTSNPIKLLLSITFTIAAVVTSSAQSWTYGGHTYIATGQASLAEAKAQAAALGGHLVVVNDAAEYAFIDANIVKRGTGWWWTGVAECGNTWTVNCVFDSAVYGQLNNHWNTYVSIQPTFGAVVVAGKLQATYRSTKWVTKFHPFDLNFSASQRCNTLIEIE